MEEIWIIYYGNKLETTNPLIFVENIYTNEEEARAALRRMDACKEIAHLSHWKLTKKFGWARMSEENINGRL